MSVCVNATTRDPNHRMLCLKVDGELWLFTDENYQPSYWLLLQREGFYATRGFFNSSSEELINYLEELNDQQLDRLYDFVIAKPNTIWERGFSVTDNISEKIINGDIQVFIISGEKAVNNMGDDCVYNSNPYGSNEQTPQGEARRKLLNTLGKNIYQRWENKDKSDSEYWDSGWGTRQLIKVQDDGTAIYEAGKSVVTGLWEMGKLIIDIASTVVETQIKIQMTVLTAGFQAATGQNDEAIKTITNGLNEFGIFINEQITKAEQLIQKAKEGLDIINSILEDPDSKALIVDYLDAYFQSMSYRDTRTLGLRITAEIGIEVLIAIATAGAGTLAMRAAQSVKFANKAAKARFIGPFTVDAIDTLADLSTTLKKYNRAEIEGPIPEKSKLTIPEKHSKQPVVQSKSKENYRELNEPPEAIPSYETPYKPLSKTQRENLKEKLNSRTITKEEYRNLEWDRRFANRRATGVRRFWAEERIKLKSGKPGTRNWTEEQRGEILKGRRPKFDGETIQGHHMYNALDHPQIANDPKYIYPATKNEHFERWHGGNWQNNTYGKPLNLSFPEEF